MLQIIWQGPNTSFCWPRLWTLPIMCFLLMHIMGTICRYRSSTGYCHGALWYWHCSVRGVCALSLNIHTLNDNVMREKSNLRSHCPSITPPLWTTLGRIGREQVRWLHEGIHSVVMHEWLIETELTCNTESECSAWATVLHYMQNIPPAAMEVMVRISASSGFQPDGAMIILSPALQFRLELPSTAIVVSPPWALLASLVHDGDLRTPWIDSCRIAGYYSKWES